MSTSFSIADHVVILDSNTTFLVVNTDTGENYPFTDGILSVDSTHTNYILEDDSASGGEGFETQIGLKGLSYFLVEAATGIGVADLRDPTKKDVYGWNLLSTPLRLTLTSEFLIVNSVDGNSPNYQLRQVTLTQ